MRERIQSILANLQAVGGDLLVLSDDIWLDIEHNDSAAVQRGAQFKIAFNKAMADFIDASRKVTELTESFTKVPSFEPAAAPDSAEERERRERVIRALDQSARHTLFEDFRYKRPVAFTLGDVPFEGTTTWQQVYETVCRHLAARSRTLFESLPDNPAFTSNHGNKYFARELTGLRLGRDFGGGVLAETNLSANQIRDMIKLLLETFGVPIKSFAVFLREDRDAARGGPVR